MKTIFRHIVVLGLCLESAAFADVNSDEKNVGEGKAIVAIRNGGRQFQLSKESTEFLGITWLTIGKRLKSKELTTLERYLVTYQNSIGIYIRSERGWIELKEIRVIKKNGESVVVIIDGVSMKDQLATNKLGMLRAAHLQASGALSNVDED